MSIATEIKAEAVRKGVSLKDLAKQIGTYPERFSRAINEERPLTTDIATKASHALGITFSELVRRTEEGTQQ